MQMSKIKEHIETINILYTDKKKQEKIKCLALVEDGMVQIEIKDKLVSIKKTDIMKLLK